MKKILTAFALASVLALTGCSETFTFEAVPSGVDDDDAETGLRGDPREIDCFTIEADSSQGDEDDVQLGEFCKTDEPSNEALDDIENEQNED